MECIADAGGGEVMGMQAFGERGVLAVCDGGAVTTWTHDNEDGAAFSSRHASRWALRPHAADEVIFEDGPVTRLAAVATDVLHDTFPLVAVASDSKPVEVASSAAAGIAFEYRSPAQLFSYKPEAVALGQPAFQAVASIPSLATAGVASPRARVSALALSASSQQLAVGDEHGCVSLWSLAEAAPRPAFACSLMGGFGPRVNGAALWLYGGQSLLLACGDRAFIVDTRAAAAATPAVTLSAADAAMLPVGGRPPAAVPRVREGCVCVAPPSPLTSSALSLALPSADDPFLLVVASDDGSLHSVDMRVPGKQLAVLAGVHEGPVWALTPALALAQLQLGSGSNASSTSSGRAVAGSSAAPTATGRASSSEDAAVEAEVPVLLSAGEDGALNATPLSALRGLGLGAAELRRAAAAAEAATHTHDGSAEARRSGQLPFDLTSPSFDRADGSAAVAGAAAADGYGRGIGKAASAAYRSTSAADYSDSHGLGWTVLRGGYPLRSLSAAAARPGAAGGLVAAGDSSGRILSTRLVVTPDQRRRGDLTAATAIGLRTF